MPVKSRQHASWSAGLGFQVSSSAILVRVDWHKWTGSGIRFVQLWCPYLGHPSSSCLQFSPRDIIDWQCIMLQVVGANPKTVNLKDPYGTVVVAFCNIL